MCGIFCTFVYPPNREHINLDSIYESCRSHIVNRGPDCNSQASFKSKDYEFLFAASVLWLQGTAPTPQPVETGHSIFVYNGDVFGGDLISDDERSSSGDTINLLKCLEKSDDVLATLKMVQGPYAFIYLDKRTMRLYFARDKYGRRSLIAGVNSSTFVLTSVFHKNVDYTCMELPALGIFCIDLKLDQFILYPWPFKHSNFQQKLAELQTFLNHKIICDQNVNIYSSQFAPPTESQLNFYKGLTGFEETFQILLQNKDWSNRVTHLGSLLETSVKKRIATQPQYCQNCMPNQSKHCCHATTGVLFSGGIDCAILALLADKYVGEDRPIDLLNVAFNNEAPDRITGRETLSELKKLCPNRAWNFVEIDVAKEELENIRSSRIKHLIYPLNSILDDSLGCALWFASRGTNNTYKSPCRVILVGMGADELFGGYTKHRAALKRGGWSELNKLLEDDWQNISHRNLARDDRVVSDHGRQLRTPYLDENLVEFVLSLNCWERTCPSESLVQGLGEKILLRSLGYHLGLIKAAGLKKRALQFGSRIANSKENAKDVSPRL